MNMRPRSLVSIALITALSLPATAQSVGDKRASVSPDAFAKKIVALIQAGNGYVTKEAVEKAFELRFARWKIGDGFAQYSVDQGAQSYLSASLQEFWKTANSADGEQSVAVVEWKNYAFGNPVAGACVDKRTFEDAVKQGGWYLGYSSERPARFDEFYRNPDLTDRQSITVYPEENCVIGVKMQGFRKTGAK
jgi:hypothetical protein